LTRFEEDPAQAKHGTPGAVYTYHERDTAGSGYATQKFQQIRNAIKKTSTVAAILWPRHHLEYIPHQQLEIAGS
uniref:Nitric oxide synthase-interacting protein zinc-finger domain-containing protein n=1 Tax=Neovison vison TaxID=452646 RepID=A0A8C7EV71_NEOVI